MSLVGNLSPLLPQPLFSPLFSLPLLHCLSWNSPFFVHPNPQKGTFFKPGSFGLKESEKHGWRVEVEGYILSGQQGRGLEETKLSTFTFTSPRPSLCPSVYAFTPDTFSLCPLIHSSPCTFKEKLNC